MNRILIVAPYVGEIGWELMTWQARVRWVFARSRYDQVIVLGGPEKAAFYQQMPLEYRPVDLTHLPGSAYEDRRIISESGEVVSSERLKDCLREIVDPVAAEWRAKNAEVDVLWPEYSGKLWPCDDDHQLFVRYEHPAETVPGPWVTFIQRTRSYAGAKNWPADHWTKLAALLNDRGIHTTVYPCEAQAAIAMLSGCDLAIGQSTGGLHLASLCGCPTMVWSVQRYLMWHWEITNRQRYETWWNPLASPVIFHDLDRLPTPEQAANQVTAALASIGRRTGSLFKQALFRGKWKARSALRRNVIEPGRYAKWPWPVQQFVRYQLA